MKPIAEHPMFQGGVQLRPRAGSLHENMAQSCEKVSRSSKLPEQINVDIFDVSGCRRMLVNGDNMAMKMHDPAFSMLDHVPR